jgi:hypothetical protein
MRKSFLSLFVVLLASFGVAFAQTDTSLLRAPDTVCVRQPVQLSTAMGAANYYYSLCAANIQQNPVFTNLGSARFNIANARAIDGARDGGKYYLFLLNRDTRSLVRLTYDSSLSVDTPSSVTNFGNLQDVVPDSASGMYLLKDKGNWVLFLTGGVGTVNATFARVDFGNSLANTPNSVNFGNLAGKLKPPRGLFVAEQNGSYFGYVVDATPGNPTLMRLNFGNNISNTPVVEDLGNIGNMDDPYDVAAIKREDSTWFMFVTNREANSLSRINLTKDLAGTPTGLNAGNLFANLAQPTGISAFRDCDRYYLFIANSTNNNILRVPLSTLITVPGTAAEIDVLLTNAGELSVPTALSPLLRDREDVVMFAPNRQNASLTRVRFAGCTTASIPSSRDSMPKVFSYSTPGSYTVYLTLNEGRPDMKVVCTRIAVLPIPGMNVSTDTLICQGDTIALVAQSLSSRTQRWRPEYNIGNLTQPRTIVFPEATVTYNVFFTYANGCTVDTAIRVEVLNNRADAGEDRTLLDGATTTLGGPMTVLEGQTFRWTPPNYLDDPRKAFPVASPLGSYTYYLTVTRTTNDLTCSSTDSVVVRTICNDLNLPNAFAPESAVSGANRFGLLNRTVVKLNLFKIYNRWGEEVFSTSDVTREWDGMFRGEIAPLGVYVWEVDGFCPSGQRIKKSGTVTLMR